MPNPYQDRARRAKAERLAKTAIELGLTALIVAEMNESAWVSLARLAATNPASPDTRQLVVQLLGETDDYHRRHRTADRRRQPGAQTQHGQSHSQPVNQDQRRRVGESTGTR